MNQINAFEYKLNTYSINLRIDRNNSATSGLYLSLIVDIPWFQIVVVIVCDVQCNE
jgi:hypothetical protein